MTKTGIHTHYKDSKADNPLVSLQRTSLARTENLKQVQKEPWPREDSQQEHHLPSWIPTLTSAPFAMLLQARTNKAKISRKNADTLVGFPAPSQSGGRQYTATADMGVELNSLRFVKRRKKQWSMRVRGFILNTIVDIEESSQGDAIPGRWANAGGWDDVNLDPPNPFWRTLVANRGHDGGNPPVYYSTACRISFARGGFSSGSVSISDLMNNERSPVIVHICRRVQAVIWNRRLITTKFGKLGLAGKDVSCGDFVCILYGCSIAVILRRKRKTKQEILQELEDDFKPLCERLVTGMQMFKKHQEYRRMLKLINRILSHI